MPPPVKCFVPSAVALVVLSGLWLALSGAATAQETQRFPIHETDGSYAEVEHVFSAVPPGGYTTLRITIDNKSKEERKWKLKTFSNTPAGRSEHALGSGGITGVAKPESTTVQEVSVPLMMDFAGARSYQERRLLAELEVSGRAYKASFGTKGMQGMPFTALSSSLGENGSGAR